MGLLNEMVGLGAGGSSESMAGGGSSSMSRSGLLIVAVPMFSGRCFLLGWLDRGGDLILFLREATGVLEDCGFRVFWYSDREEEWYFLGPAGTLGVGAASSSS